MSATLMLSFIISAAGSFAQGYHTALQSSTMSGKLSETQYDSLRHMLGTGSFQSLRDTLIIKYEYETGEAAIYNEKDDELIQQNVTDELRMLHNAQVCRKNISVFSLVEPGANADSTLEYNNTAMLDQFKLVQRLLLNNTSQYNSIIVFPNGSFTAFQCADGWAALRANHLELQQLSAKASTQMARF